MKYSFQKGLSTISPTIKFLTISDAILTAALGLFGPIFAVYLTQQIYTENVIQVIGVGASIYLFTRSIGQVPLAYLIDKIPGEKDDFYILMVGNTIFIIVPLLYLLISQPWHLFLIQFIYGLGAALTYPTWNAIFTRHIDKGKEGLEWGIYQTLNDLSGAIAAPVGSLIVSLYGFGAVMLCAAGLGIVNMFVTWIIKSDLYLKKFELPPIRSPVEFHS